MKRLVILFVLSSLFCTPSFAQGVDDTLNGLSTFWQKIDTFRCDFVQTKRLALFADEVVSRGTFDYKKPGIMVWRYLPPEEMIVGIRPGLVTVYLPSLKKAKRIHSSGRADIPPEMSFSMDQTKDAKALKENFDLTVVRKDGVTEMTLVPKAKKGTITKIVIAFMKDYTPVYFTIVDVQGYPTTFEFTNQKVNVPADDALFDVIIPNGVPVEEIGG